MKTQSRFRGVLLAGGLILLFCCPVAAQQNQTKPRRTVTLPRHLTNISQPIPEQLELPNTPRTARNVQCFRSFTKNSAMTDGVRKGRIPDEHQGSGIYIFLYFLYDMNDGSVVAIGTADLKTLLYVTHAEKTGSKSLLRKIR
jgi:hypothetical protein